MVWRKSEGFTLVEIMVAVGIIGLLSAIAIPNFAKAREDAQRNTCKNNMRQIDGAKQRWALDNNKTTANTPTSAELDDYIRSGFPDCPAGGTYAIENIDENPSCDEHGSVW